ncbi:MAG: crossover junction endodeoxyribonuclease RuvC, partial [Parcubacteria group bacterium Gr01-1014_66]
MRVLGIDPGTTAIGYALIELRERPILEKADLFRITSSAPDLRLKELHHSLSSLITHTSPHLLSVEKLFFARNVKTAMQVSEARGVILLTAALSGLTVYEYTPLEIKKGLTGDGRADKT